MKIVEQGRIAWKSCDICIETRVQDGNPEAQGEQDEQDDEEKRHQAEGYCTEDECSHTKYQEAAVAKFFNQQSAVESCDQVAQRGREKEQCNGCLVDAVVSLYTGDEDSEGSVV